MIINLQSTYNKEKCNPDLHTIQYNVQTQFNSIHAKHVLGHHIHSCMFAIS